MYKVGDLIVWHYGEGAEEVGVIDQIFTHDTMQPVRTWQSYEDQASVQFPGWKGHVFLSDCLTYDEWRDENDI